MQLNLFDVEPSARLCNYHVVTSQQSNKSDRGVGDSSSKVTSADLKPSPSKQTHPNHLFLKFLPIIMAEDEDRTSLSTLPVELVIAILGSSRDIQSLSATVLSCGHIYRIFLEAQHQLISKALFREVDVEVIPGHCRFRVLQIKDGMDQSRSPRIHC